MLYGAKLAVFAAISLGVAVVTSFGAFFLGQVRHRQPPGHRRHQVPGVVTTAREADITLRGGGVSDE